jgi:hypothetical protein
MRTFGAVFLFCVIVIGLISAGAPERNTGSKGPDRHSSDHLIAASTQGPQIEWRYFDSKDEMRGESVQYAALESESLLEFQFPYNGGSTPSLTLRRRPKELSVMLKIDKGQFSCSSVGTDFVVAKFDEGPLQSFKCIPAQDLTPNILFIEPEKKFIEALRKSKRLILEAKFFQAGSRQMTFKTEGLNW